MDDTFAVRTCTAATEAIKYHHEWAVSEHWDPGPDGGLDFKYAFHPSYPEGFFVGAIQEEDKEQVVSCICAMKYNDIGYISFYIVGDPRRRKKGYGIRTFQHAINQLSSCSWIGLCAKAAEVEIYKRLGFVVQAPVVRYSGDRITADTNATTVDLASVPIEQLVHVDQRYTGTYRPDLITHWVRYHTTQKDCYGVAIIEEGQTVAFACMRRFVSGTYVIAPIYADTSDLAYDLVAKLTSVVDGGNVQFAADAYMGNPGAEDLFFQKLGWKLMQDTPLMYIMWRKGPAISMDAPEKDSSGCFAIISPGMG